MTSSQTESDVSAEAPNHLSWMVLFAVCVAVLILPASLTGTSVALPSIGRALGGSLQELQWVVNAYNLTFACFMLASGSVADILGRRRVFVAGAVTFIAGSALSALAPNMLALDLLRAVAGTGAAMVMTSGTAILVATFTGAALGRAFAILGSAAGAGLALGPSIAGGMVSLFGWQAVFICHALVAAVAMIGLPAIKESRNPVAAKIDYAGTLVLSGAVFALVFAIVQVTKWGLTDVKTLGCLAFSAVLFAAFAAVEKRVAHPMLDLNLLANRSFLGISLVPVALTLTFVSLLVHLPIMLTSTRGMSAGAAGLVMLMLTLPVLIVPMAVAKAMGSGTVSARRVLFLSVLVAGVGALILSLAGGDVSLLVMAAGLVVVGVGMGISAGTVDGLAVSTVGPERAGTAAGLFNTMRLASEAIGIALIGSAVVRSSEWFIGRDAPGVDASAVSQRLGSGDVTVQDTLSASDWADAAAGYAHGFELVFATTGVLSLLAAVVVLTLLKADGGIAHD